MKTLNFSNSLSFLDFMHVKVENHNSHKKVEINIWGILLHVYKDFGTVSL